jgi:hypothetical protein
MAGFLDKQDRIIDMVLTGYGKTLLSKGDLRFVYWAPFDDEVDYDPYISQSGSMTAVQLSSSRQDFIESTLVREATAGYRELTTRVKMGAASFPVVSGAIAPHAASNVSPSGDGWIRIVDEYGDFLYSGSVLPAPATWTPPVDVEVAFGGNGSWAYGTVTAGTFISNVGGGFRTFFGSDPLPGVVKNLWARPLGFNSDTTNVIRPLFTMPQGQMVLPRLVISPNTSGTLALEVRQRKIQEVQLKQDGSGQNIESLGPYDRGYERYDTEYLTLEFGYTPGTFPADYQHEGILVRIYRNQVEGVTEVRDRRDLENQISYGNDLKLWVSSGQEKTDADQD